MSSLILVKYWIIGCFGMYSKLCLHQLHTSIISVMEKQILVEHWMLVCFGMYRKLCFTSCTYIQYVSSMHDWLSREIYVGPINI